MATIEELDNIVAKLRKVKYGDFVLASDHNDLVDAVTTIRDILKKTSLSSGIDPDTVVDLIGANTIIPLKGKSVAVNYYGFGGVRNSNGVWSVESRTLSAAVPSEDPHFVVGVVAKGSFEVTPTSSLRDYILSNGSYDEKTDTYYILPFIQFLPIDEIPRKDYPSLVVTCTIYLLIGYSQSANEFKAASVMYAYDFKEDIGYTEFLDIVTYNGYYESPWYVVVVDGEWDLASDGYYYLIGTFSVYDSDLKLLKSVSGHFTDGVAPVYSELPSVAEVNFRGFCVGRMDYIRVRSEITCDFIVSNSTYGP